MYDLLRQARTWVIQHFYRRQQFQNKGGSKAANRPAILDGDGRWPNSMLPDEVDRDGYRARNTSEPWFTAHVTDDGDSGVYRVRDSNGNIVFDIAVFNLDGAGGGHVEFRFGDFYTFDGNVGFGTTDVEAWASGFSAVQLDDSALMFGGNILNIIENAYFDGAWKYRTTNPAARHRLGNGIHQLLVAASGTADTAITWIEALRIIADGKVAIGDGVTPTHDLHVQNQGSVTTIKVSDTATQALVQAGPGSVGARIILDDNRIGGNRWDIQPGTDGALNLLNDDTGTNVLKLTVTGHAQPNALGEAWNAVSFNTGWGHAGTGYDGQYRKFGDMVMLRGAVERTSGSSLTIATLPAGYRPSARVQGLATSAGDTGIQVAIQTNGEIVIAGSYSSPDDVWLDGIMFSI